MKGPVFGLLILLPAVSLAQGKRLAVVELDTPPNMIGLGGQLAQSVITAAEAQGYRINSPESVRAQLGEERMKQVWACGGKSACVVSKLQGVVADRVVVGSLNRDEKHYLVKLWLIDMATSELVADVDRAILIASRRLQSDVTEAVPGLLRGEKEARGKLRLTANTRAVDVTVDGEPVGKTPLLLELKPGKHQLKAEKKAYYPIDRYVVITANTTTEEELRLVRIPGQIPDDEAVPGLPALQATQLEKAKPGIPHEAIALGGAAVVLAGAGTGFLLAYNRVLREQGAGYAQTPAGKADQLNSTVLFAGAGAAALAAVIFGLTLDGDGTTVSPAVAEGSGGLVFSGQF